jgi:hypothetical protein
MTACVVSPIQYPTPPVEPEVAGLDRGAFLGCIRDALLAAVRSPAWAASTVLQASAFGRRGR